MESSRSTRAVSAGLVLLAGLAGWPGCASMGSSTEAGFLYKDLPIASGSAVAGDGQTVTMRGEPKALAGPGIRVGDSLRDAKLATGDLSLVNIAETKGRVRIISLVPSLDTRVCEQQTHYLSEKNNGLDKMAQLITVSVDTPFAQSRFAREARIGNVTFLSDYRGGEFGRTYGLLVKDPHFLARAVMVVDKENVIRYLQITPELGQLPDMDAAFRAARALMSPNAISH